MSRLDDLVAGAGDASLHRDLEEALAELRRRKPFGLIFEAHLPETTALYGLPVHVGTHVQYRRETGGHIYKVVSVTAGGRKAKREPLNGSGEALTAFVRDLLVIERFEEPVYSGITPIGGVHRGGSRRPWHDPPAAAGSPGGDHRRAAWMRHSTRNLRR